MWWVLSNQLKTLRAKTEVSHSRKKNSASSLLETLPEFPVWLSCSEDFELKTAISTLAWVSTLPAHSTSFRIASHNHVSQFLKINLCFSLHMYRYSYRYMYTCMYYTLLSLRIHGFHIHWFGQMQIKNVSK